MTDPPPYEPYSISVSLLSGSFAPAGPGWYISGVAAVPGTKPPWLYIQQVRISAAHAEAIARAFEDAIGSRAGIDIQVRPFQIIKDGNDAAKRLIEEELHFAEEQASRIAALRKSRSEFGD